MDNSVFVLLPSGFLFVIFMFLSMFAKGYGRSRAFLKAGIVFGFICLASVVSLAFDDAEWGMRIVLSLTAAFILVAFGIAFFKAVIVIIEGLKS